MCAPFKGGFYPSSQGLAGSYSIPRGSLGVRNLLIKQKQAKLVAEKASKPQKWQHSTKVCIIQCKCQKLFKTCHKNGKNLPIKALLNLNV